MSKTMAEVLAEHQWMEHDSIVNPHRISCICGSDLGAYENASSGDEVHVDHQAAALSAAGFGPVQEARADAWAAGYDKGTDLAAWAISNRTDMELPDTTNPYREDM